MEIILEKCKLRAFVEQDAISLANHANNYNIAKFLRDGFPYPYTIEHAEGFILNSTQSKHINLAIEVNNEICGVVSLIFHHTKIKEAELGFWLGESLWNRGIITNAVGGLLKYAFTELKLKRIYSFCLTNNIASKKVHEKLGFRCLGTTIEACGANGNREAFSFELLNTTYT